MRRSLVTGGAGFIGSHVADELLRMGHEVVVLDDLSGGALENVPQDAHFVEGSILDHRLLNELFDAHRFNYVYHLAAYAAEGLSHFIKRFNYCNNLIGTVNLLNASVNFGVSRFVFTSSIAVYGTAQPPVTEDMTPAPEDPYGIAKFACEQEMLVTQRIFDLSFTIFRPHNVYGPRQNIGDRYRNVVGIFMNQLLQKQPMVIFGDGQQIRAFTHVDDVAPMIAQCVTIPETANEVFNVGADVPYTINELAGMVAIAMGDECRVVNVAPRPEVKIAFADHKKASRAFGSLARVPLRRGLQEMAAWVRDHGARRSSAFESLEIEQQLPDAWRNECCTERSPSDSSVLHFVT